MPDVSWFDDARTAMSVTGARPARDANIRNNALAEADRAERWRPARDALWRLLDPLLDSEATIAIVGAGNCDDIPLTRIAARAARVDLIDLDADVAREALSREPEQLQGRCRVVDEDASAGAADIVTVAARDGKMPEALPQWTRPIGDGPYDVVVGDLLYSQLLFPALLSLGLEIEDRARYLGAYGQPVTRLVMERMHAAARPGGVVVHLHDLACWTPGHAQPVALATVLEDPDRHLASLLQPAGCDTAREIEAIGAEIADTQWWVWPYAPGTDYLVRADVVRV